MKITFEGKTYDDIIAQMEDMLEVQDARSTGAVLEPPGPGPGEVEVIQKDIQEVLQKISKTVPVDAPKRARTGKQLANDERMRTAALERVAARRAAKAVEKPVEKAVEKAVEKPVEKPVEGPGLFADPSEAVRIRQKTIEDLQKAYANGHQQEVFELLSRFGNGARTFRELPPEAFMPIREAIDKGALT